MLLTRRSQFRAEDADEVSPKFTTLDHEVDATRSTDSDSEREILESDEELDVGVVDKNAKAIAVEQPSHVRKRMAGGDDDDDGDAVMDDVSDGTSDDDDLFAIGPEEPVAKTGDALTGQTSLEHVLKLHLEELRAIHTDALARVDALLKSRSFLSDQLASLNAAMSARKAESSLQDAPKTSKVP